MFEKIIRRKKNKVAKMGCYLIITYQLFFGLSGELSMEKASGSAAKVSSKTVKELEIA